MSISTGLFTSSTCEWTTPQNIFDILNKEFGPFSLDPCATVENAKCVNFFTIKENGLKQKWRGKVFMNPPYGSQIGKWVAKAFRESLNGSTIVCLLPSRTDTAWFHNFCTRGLILFIKGRLRFGEGINTAPFPSMVVVFGPKFNGPPNKQSLLLKRR
jgi:phage N-6-adenine-methyltransferase